VSAALGGLKASSGNVRPDGAILRASAGCRGTSGRGETPASDVILGILGANEGRFTGELEEGEESFVWA